MVVVLVTIVLVAVAIYASVLFFQRSFEERITKAKSSIEEILDSPLEEELAEVKGHILIHELMEQASEVVGVDVHLGQ